METTVLKVDGMMCEACVGHVRTALLGVAGVSEALVDLESGRATVRHEGASMPAMVAAVVEEGYEAAVV